MELIKSVPMLSTRYRAISGVSLYRSISHRATSAGFKRFDFDDGKQLCPRFGRFRELAVTRTTFNDDVRHACELGQILDTRPS